MDEKKRLDTLNKELQKIGYIAKRCPKATQGAGQYKVFKISSGQIMAGHKYGLTLDDVEMALNTITQGAQAQEGANND